MTRPLQAIVLSVRKTLGIWHIQEVVLQMLADLAWLNQEFDRLQVLDTDRSAQVRDLEHRLAEAERKIDVLYKDLDWAIASLSKRERRKHRKRPIRKR